ncbi:hypothetical protein DOTSEDRAFT_54194 [Dothistroma septosporum NZE10]|uniref:Uncharacterized protein n=1 Tax=Dothistroma septosporum (strain NZE10 / CBS 128990) TaxID=675120 RepID=M2YN07_DOTSN|nr:hypothetical protein DOTSEDRAFT_54194 [Dothistroma septosporum NZE10]
MSREVMTRGGDIAQICPSWLVKLQQKHYINSLKAAFVLVLALQNFCAFADSLSVQQDGICKFLIQHKAHVLSNRKKKPYLDPEKCLMKMPTHTLAHLPVATALFEASRERHVLQYKHIHEVGAFWPFDGHMNFAHEHLPGTERNCVGAQPWWD